MGVAHRFFSRFLFVQKKKKIHFYSLLLRELKEVGGEAPEG